MPGIGRWVGWAVVLVVASTPAIGAEGRPNVVLIVADDLGGVDLGCYGSTFHRTPNLDRLAAQGRRFTQAYAAAPVCSPTRAALMTGKHPARLGLTDWLPGAADRPSRKLTRPPLPDGLPLEEVTLAERLKQAGYATGTIGKWHLGGSGFEPTRQGFDINIGGDDTGTPMSYTAPFRRGGRSMVGLEDAPDGQYLTDRLGLEAERFIDSHKAEPFFLYLPHYGVHLPMVAKDDLVAHYPKWDGIARGKQQNPTYAAMLESLDQAVGKVLAAIDRTGLAERTIVIFTSDNGGLATREGPNTPATSNAPLREGKGWLYAGGLRVPLIVRWPGKITPGSEAKAVWSLDLPPTILGLCGLPSVEGFDGLSLAGLLTEGKTLERRALIWHYPHYSNQGGSPGGAILDGPWKLIESYETGRLELFDLSRDPGEANNLAQKFTDQTKYLSTSLTNWRLEVGARMPVMNPAYVPNPPGSDGSITLAASTAEVHGVMLRFEPLPHKNTLGYWTLYNDWASWEFTVDRPGEFEVEALVGCGTGSGGGVVDFRFEGRSLRLTVPVTGGFQNFEKQRLGKVMIEEPGRHRVEVRPVSKPGPAVMDLREVKLVPVRPAPG